MGQSDPFHVLWEDSERAFGRLGRDHAEAGRYAFTPVASGDGYPTLESINRLSHEYGLRDCLDGAWALRPTDLVRTRERLLLVVEYRGGEPLHRLIGQPMEIGEFLRIGIALSAALGRLHARGIIHKDIKPANVIVDYTTSQVWLTGFGTASRLTRERQLPEPPEFIAGTLAYMAPEQTGRVNRCSDSRSDLYSLGVTFYEMLTGSLPFTASDPMEWVHCHVAKQPAAPGDRSRNVPALLSAITMKLLSKAVEERYQTAAGVEHDLRQCLAQWEGKGRIDGFALASRDVPDRLLIPETLYGRDDAIETLLAAFDRVVEHGAPELILVSGYSGIGKSSFVHELHRVLVPWRGLFATGKFDESKRNIPYATLAQAIKGLVRPLLGSSEADLVAWRGALQEALGPNSRLIVDLVPDLELIIGEPPPIAELPSQDAQRRFQLVLRRFIAAFAQAEHPLALFLDDLQWLDAATLDLLEGLLTQPDVRYLLLIGAYRDNEVEAAHPLMRKLRSIRQTGVPVREIHLPPLSLENVDQLVADTLHCEPQRSAALARLLYEKTAGNPFFLTQFVRALADEGLLAFDHDRLRWGWELERIHAKGYTDNVADLMVAKLRRLPDETRRSLQVLACLGSRAEVPMLSLAREISEEQVHLDLRPAVLLELIEPFEGSYKFVHDRVQEAAYSLMPEPSRPAAHLRLGSLLAIHTPPEKREEAIFDIVNQLNRGAASITAPDERERAAELNLLAGRRAKESAAFASALTYFVTGAALLAEVSSTRRRELTFALELNRAECEYVTGEPGRAEERLSELAGRAATLGEQAAVAALRVDLYTLLDRSEQAICVGLDYLRHLGVEWPLHPTAEAARHEYERIWSQLETRAIEDLVELPVLSDETSIATLDILQKLIMATYAIDDNLHALVSCRAVNLSLERGNCDASCFAYVWLGAIAGSSFGDYETGYRFGRLGCELVERHGWKRLQPRTYDLFGSLVVPWTRPFKDARDLLRRAFEGASGIGDMTFAVGSCADAYANMLAAGDHLRDVEREAAHGLEFARTAGFGAVGDIIAAQLGLARTLRGLTRRFASFDDDQFDERLAEQRFASNPNLHVTECWYWIHKLQAHFLAGDSRAAVAASCKAERLLWTSRSQLQEAEYHFYSALSHAACCDFVSADERRQHLEALALHRGRLDIWARNCPENFENRALLAAAEAARLDGRDRVAMDLYEQAIRSARDNGLVHNEGVANELAGRFYASRGFEKITNTYLRDARYCYLRWGANGKVQQLEQLHPELRAETAVTAPTSTISVPVEHLDLSTVIQVSEAVAGEIVLERLIEMVMRTAVEHAGADRGLLILRRGNEYSIEAEICSDRHGIKVHLQQAQVTSQHLPESVFRYVLRTKESVLLNDASADNPFSADDYLCKRHSQSLLCLPIVKQMRLLGMLYLENSLTRQVFTPARMAILRLLASEAAISIENASLYRDLAQREAKIRRLVDANIIGIFIFRLPGQILEANDAFLRMVGYEREDLVSGRLSWTNLTPTEWSQLRSTGTLRPFEQEFFRKDGSRVPVLAGVATLEESTDESVAFVLDLTERERAAQAHRELQAELAHANRLATMGQIGASVAHEVNQAIGAVSNNTSAALRFLSADPPDLAEIKDALECVARDTHRAGDIIGRIRDLAKKRPPRHEAVDLNGAIEEVIAVVRGELSTQRVSVRTQLAGCLPPVRGDRVQLQQVVMNLILNSIEAMSAVDDLVRELVISTEPSPTVGVLVAICDSGPGVVPEDRERIFDSFYTTKAKGVGIGLSICRSIILAHGGRLWADSHQPRGAAFRFTLPGNLAVS